MGVEPNESSSWRAAWVSLSAVQHCAYSCSNRVQVCVDAHAMAALEVAGGGPRAPPSLDPSIPVDVLPLAVPLELLYDRQRRPALEGGEDRNTDADRSRVFLYVTSTPSESRRPSSLSGIRNGPGAYTAQLGPVLSEKLPTWVGWDPPRQLACPGETSM